MSKTDNLSLPPRIRWLLFVISASVAPPLFRIAMYFFSVHHVEYFWESETDMIASCLAITIAFFAELQSVKKGSIVGIPRVIAILMVFIPLLLITMFFALNYDHEKEINMERYITELKDIGKVGNEKTIEELLSNIDKIYQFKLILFLIASLFTIMISVGSYWFLFLKGGKHA